MEAKKNPKVDYRKKSALFFNIGLVISLALVISAFEWKVAEKVSWVDIDQPVFGGETIMVPPTVHTPPQKPPVRQISVITVVDDEVEVDEIEYDLAIDKDPVIEVVEASADLPEEEAEEVFDIVETDPSFKGGLGEFYKFVGKNLKYPAQARRIGVEGKVFAQFIVDKDGSLSDIKVVRGIGAGCDEEVLRILNKSPKWNPGKQRGRPVKVRMIFPITFKLQ